MRKSLGCWRVINMVAANVTVSIIDCFGQSGTSLYSLQLKPIKSGGDTPSQCSKTFKWCKYLFLISYFQFKSTIKCRHYACRIPAYIVFDGRQYCLHQHNTFLPDSTKHMHLWTSYFYHILTLTVYISCLKRVILNETIIIVQYLWRYWTIRHYHITFGLGYYTPRCPSVR